MWTTTLGSVGPTRKTDQNSEALAAYVRAEYGDEDVAWFLAEVRRTTHGRKTKHSSNGAHGAGKASGVTA